MRQFETAKNAVETADPTKAAQLAAFGKANRAQTPVKGIITGTYGQEAESYFKSRQDETLLRVSKPLPTTNTACIIIWLYLLSNLSGVCVCVSQRMNQGKKPRPSIGTTRAH